MCLHGTTTTGLRAILAGEDKPVGPWTVSDRDGTMYVWTLPKLLEEMGCEEEDTDIVEFVGEAFESAQVQAVVTQDEWVYALVLDIPETLLSDDWSCENMANRAGCLNTADFRPEMIKKVYRCPFNRWMSPWVVRGLLENEYFNEYEVDPLLLEVAQAIDNPVECHREFDYEEILVGELTPATIKLGQ